MKRFKQLIWATPPPKGDPLEHSSAEIENVCFKGGGILGTAFVGVGEALIDLNIFAQIKRFIGSSAGAIFASAFACRVPINELSEAVKGTDFAKFQDSPWGIAGEGVRLYEYMGIYDGDYFYEWYSNLLKKFAGSETLTFQEVFEKFGSELVITTTDLTAKKLVYLNRRDFPDMQIRDAVRKSMSIPGFFIPVSEMLDDETHVYVDGGCTNNFPLGYFDDLYESSDIAFGKTIGFSLNEAQTDSKISNIVALIMALITTDMEEIEKLRLTPKDEYRTVKIDTFGYDYTDFNISEKEISKLIDSGYNSTIDFFKKSLDKE